MRVQKHGITKFYLNGLKKGKQIMGINLNNYNLKNYILFWEFVPDFH